MVQAAQFGALDAHLPSNAEPTLIALRDKVRQRRMFRAASIPTPRQVVIDADTDSDQIALAFPLPAVLKPVAGMGSIGTVRIAALDDLAAAVRSVRQIVECDPRTAHLTPQLVLEEELLGDPEATHGNTRGDYVSVEALTTAAGTRILAVQDKLPLAQPFRETGDLMPTVREGEELDAIIECAQGALSALGITFGVTHTEIKLTAEGPRIIEVNGRPGGGVCEMLALAADYDLVLHQARAAVDVDYCPPEVKFRSFAAYLSPQPPLGRWRLTAAASRQDLGRERAIAEIWEVQAVGAVVDAHDGTSSNLLRLLATADSQDELAALGSRLSSTDYFKLLPAADERTTR
ncbi:hypothetical protein AWB96_15640 [Mycobacteroides chelonae]|uniref:ATP-grasp domain-containing protein n=1 Tax=Mycobacteroides chelonae TaxID=1774 RepID=UPI000696044F|nr:ATP-grasp domain-containing protein [Mycobacteroides chelonae]ANB00872.1 hypothetical protein BB28_08235 [Mycobacteroides chelonae CCUG 47445]OLT75160.1 hypothetical protein BKG56_15400 [Mycobacteroides chelonae]ORV12808.1 hypothetical protein AWB96_15640 [Mycobacteroides chelonae]